jgi:hypothetical protein
MPGSEVELAYNFDKSRHLGSDAINGEKEVANASRVDAVDVVANCSVRPAEEMPFEIRKFEACGINSTMIGGRTAYSRTSAGGGMVRPAIQIGDRPFKSPRSCQKFRRVYLPDTQTPTSRYCRLGAVEPAGPGSFELIGEHSSRSRYSYSKDIPESVVSNDDCPAQTDCE